MNSKKMLAFGILIVFIGIQCWGANNGFDADRLIREMRERRMNDRSIEAGIIDDEIVRAHEKGAKPNRTMIEQLMATGATIDDIEAALFVKMRMQGPAPAYSESGDLPPVYTQEGVAELTEAQKQERLRALEEQERQRWQQQEWQRQNRPPTRLRRDARGFDAV